MTLPQRIGVYGGGRMGAGIAHAFLVVGVDVTVIESDEGAAEAARARVATSLERARQHGVESAASLEVTCDAQRLAGCELVVEAVPELPELKARVLATIERCAPEADVATNTSSLSVDSLAGSLSRPERFLGLHFFNPVPASDLVEIVVGGATAPALVERAQDWVAGLGKTAVTVRDGW